MPKTPNQQVKLQHLDRIRALLRTHTTATKAELAQWSGLSVVTLGSLIAQLASAGEVLPDAMLPADMGRPAQVYRFNADYKHALALCIVQQQTTYRIAAFTVDLQGRVLDTVTGALSPSPTEALLSAAAHACERDPLIASVAVGIPGQAVNGTILFCDEPLLAGVALEALLHAQTNLPVLVENDMNALAYGYAQRTTPKSAVTAAVYFPNNQCPGAGLLVNGCPLPGLNGMAGEVVNLPVSVDWHNPPAPIELCISDCLQAITAVLAPQQIVLYRETLDMPLLKSLIAQRWPPAMPRPALIAETQLLPDYALGMQRLALKPLWPKENTL